MPPSATDAVVDLPAPKAKPLGAAAATVKSPPSVPAGIVDLPAPKPRGEVTDLPAPKAKPLELADLPTPKAKPAELADLPTPKAKAEIADLPAPKPKTELADLPAPKAPAKVGALPPKPAGILPPKPAMPSPLGPKSAAAPIAPKPSPLGAAGATMKGAASVPRSPAAPPPGGEPLELDLELPGTTDDVTQGGLSFDDGIDLPTPVAGELTPAAGEVTPKAAGDLAPKGFFDDLPQPARTKQGGPETKAGFFDDLPQPAATKPGGADTAARGFFDDLVEPVSDPATTATALAPKGFFDDLPGRPNPSKPATADVAPKGFFDDLPGRPNTSKPPGSEVAPKGFFDDLPQPTAKPRSVEQQVTPKAAKPVEPPPDVEPLDLDPADLELAEASKAAPLPKAPASKVEAKTEPDPGKFDDLDLSEPTATPIRFEAAKARSAEKPGAPPKLDTLPSQGDALLELEGDAKPSPSTAQLGFTKDKDSKDAAKAARDAKKAARDEAKKPPMSGRTKKILAIATVGVLGLGAGGFVFYQRHAAAQERKDQISAQLAAARSAMAAADATHWQRAANAAGKVLDMDDAHPEALGISAEASLAQALAEGVNAQLNFSKAQKRISRALEVQAKHPALERAQALNPLAQLRAEIALPKLEVQQKKHPADPAIALYLGWAQAMRSDFASAVKSFDVAAKGEAVKLYALYGRARAKLALGEIDGAKADFGAVLDLKKDHVPAQVGLASTLPAAQAQQQEADLLAILQRKDIATADPRAIVEAWGLVAASAQRGGRLDAARERYRKAIEAAKALPINLAGDVPAMTGLAEVELRDNNAKVAYDWISKATTANKDDVRAQLVAAQIEIALKNLDSAGARLTALSNRNPPPPKIEQANLKLAYGRLLEAQEEHAKAAEAFVEAAALAGDLDLAPALAAVAKLTQLATEARAAKDDTKAGQLTERADKLLADIAKNAEKDLQLALALGTSYLRTDDAVKAEPWLRRYVDARPQDPEGQYQLSKALAKLGKFEDAIERLRKAVELDPSRIEIGLELARTYEAAGRDSDAVLLYTRLVANKDVSIEVRARAGRFFARTNQIEKAAEQGDKILAVDEKHPVGLYLKGEGLLGKGETTPARQAMSAAATADPNDAQFLDGQGRAAEADAAKTGDTALQDVALRAYMAANVIAPKMLNPWVGEGRLYVLRKEFKKAIPALLKAVEIAPNNSEVAFLMGVSYAEIGENKVAIQWLEKATSSQPNADASHRIGKLYLAANNGPKAAAALKTATTIAVEDEKKTGKTRPWLTEAFYDLGQVYLDMNNEAGARAAWQTFVDRNPPAGQRRTTAQQALETTLKR